MRAATGAPTGNALGSVASFVACLVLALVKQPVLTVVTLSAVPLMLVTAAGTQRVVEPMYRVERRCFAEASASVERATSAVATVKAQNAEALEVARFRAEVGGARESLVRQAAVWATSLGTTDFLMFGMYAVGCWYGAKIVADGKASAEDVLTVIWASLMASAALQGVMPQLTVLTKGNASLASLLSVIQSRDGNYDKRGFRSGPPPHQHTDPNRPRRFRGEFDLQRVSFHYPSRPDVPVLRDITLFLPAGETTFIVGGSGSGKSTIAQLLLRMYKPGRGAISLDNRALDNFPDTYTRQHVAAVQQGCILFDLSVHDNVAMGIVGAGPDMFGEVRRPGDVSRADVVDACKMASIHEFIESLPDGYETRLGTSGAQLSGGQRQRLAIARARIRDPTVLILDEATSALDATSRVDVFNALKAWRRNSTTIVITHDLSQITPADYVYVMADGVVADHGFRSDLQARAGPFADMAARQAVQPLPPRDDFEWRPAPAAPLPEAEDDAHPEHRLSRVGWNMGGTASVRASRPSSIASLADLGGVEIQRRKTPVKVKRAGMILHASGVPGKEHARKLSGGSVPRSISQESLVESHSDAGHPSAQGHTARRHSMQPPPSAYGPHPGYPLTRAQRRLSWTSEDLGSGPYRRHSASAASATSLRSMRTHSQSSLAEPWRRDTSRVSVVSVASAASAASFGGDKGGELADAIELVDVALGDEKEAVGAGPASADAAAPDDGLGKPPGLTLLARRYYATMPAKPLLWVGMFGAVGHGVCVPVYSFFLAKLLALIGAKSTGEIALQGATLVALAAAQAACGWMQHFGASAVAARWNEQLRAGAYARVMAQDKGWFDARANAPAQLTQRLVKDVEDMRNLVAVCVPALIVMAVMIVLGISWALAVGWQMTLVGISIVPAIGAMYLASEGAVQRAEERNKGRREAVAKTFFETLANVRGIRGMALEDCFRERFAAEAAECRTTGLHAGLVVSVAQAAGAAMPLCAQALLLFVAATFIGNGTMAYPNALQVITLVLFSLTFGAQMLVFLPLLSKAKVAARDFHRIASLSLATCETRGDARPARVAGDVAFEDVAFAYPERSDVPVLAHFSLRVARGESVALVGASGCGKSTVAALLQRLYEPGAGRVTLDGHALDTLSAHWLRRHIGVVSQTANLFDDTVLANLRYGAEADVPLADVHAACRAANIHDFIESLPQGYATKLGENAALISGGQAQRIQIARALIRKPRILILDECTSALDVENQRIILDTVDAIRSDCTTFFITHSTEAMKRCDRIVCLQDGRVVEDGSYASLIAKGGTFAQLMRSGEWE